MPKSLGGPVAQSDADIFVPWLSLRKDLTFKFRMNLYALQKTWVWSLGQEDSLEEEMATHSSMVAWKISWTEAGGLQSMQTIGHD